MPSYRQNADIRNMQQERKPIAKTEYTNYEEYLQAQKELNEQYQSLPAKICTLCGYPMDYKGHKLSKSEKKWSVHDVCKQKMNDMLDRESGVARERREAERRANNYGKRF